MNIKHISLAFAAAAALLAGCAKNPIETPSDTKGLTDLELTHVGATETKAAIDGATFPTDGKIGMFLFTDEAATKPYGETGYANIKYAYNSDKKKWTANPSIKVGSTPGYLYGYYPYSSEVTSIKAIPVKSSLNGDDVMYADKVSDVTSTTASQTAITMNHALARVSITVKNNGYTGNAELTTIKFGGAKVAPTGTLNALDGSITATESDVTLDFTGDAKAITAAGTTYECLLVPSAEISGKQTVKLTLTIDEQVMTATLSGDNGVIIAQGTKSNITINLSNSGISVQTVSVEDWNVVEVGGNKVTVKFAYDVTPYDILTEAHVDGNNVIIKASSFQSKRLICNVVGDAQCVRAITSDKFTFTISEISSDIDAVLGYAQLVTLTVTSDSNGKVWIGDDKNKTTDQFEQGEQVVIHTAPNDNFNLFGWNDNNKESSRTITIGATDVTYSAKFIHKDAISGLFTVDANKKQVFFSKGNLWYGKAGDAGEATFNFEANQYDTTPSENNKKRSDTHISHFMWCDNATDAMALKYESGWDGLDKTFFAAKNFTVNGYSGWSVLTGGSTGEWKYLINYNDECGTTVRSGKYKYGVTVCGQTNCLILLPDDWKWDKPTDEHNVGTSWQTEYPATSDDKVTWKKMEDAGAVCLPAAGYRVGYNGNALVSNVGGNGYYWSASPYDDYYAYDLFFLSGNVNPNNSVARNRAQSVRLVTESK